MTLPDGFEALAPWVETWALDGTAARAARRQASDYADLKAYYELALEYAPRALDYLRTKELGAMEPADETLLRMMLAFAEVTPAVEFYQQPQVIDGFPAEKFRIVDALPDLAPQE